MIPSPTTNPFQPFAHLDLKPAPSMATNREEFQVPRRVQYLLDSCSYKILCEFDTGVSALVYKEMCVPMNSTMMAIKFTDMDCSRPDLDDIGHKSTTSSLLSHPNILKAHYFFTVNRHLWVVMH